MTSKTTVLAVVFLVGVFALIGVGGIVMLAALQVDVPGQLETLTATAIGGLIGILASTRSTLGANDVAPPQPPVNVMPTQQVRLPQAPPPPTSPLRQAPMPGTTYPTGVNTAAVPAGGGTSPSSVPLNPKPADPITQLAAQQASSQWIEAGGGAGMGAGSA